MEPYPETTKQWLRRTWWVPMLASPLIVVPIVMLWSILPVELPWPFRDSPTTDFQRTGLSNVEERPVPALRQEWKAQTFREGECFQHNGIREPWEPHGPDGIIAKRGYEQYLVMFHNEAERRGGGAKFTIPWSIKGFDEAHHPIACPEAWITHNKKRR